MSGSLFESLVRNSMTLITDIDESESMVVHEGDMFARAEASEDPEIQTGIERQGHHPRRAGRTVALPPPAHAVKMLYLDENSFEDEGVEPAGGYRGALTSSIRCRSQEIK